MKILLIADKIYKGLYDYFDRERWSDIDLILSAGDLKAKYLTFLVTLINYAPLYYVRGNHDLSYKENPPAGCIDIHKKVVNHQGLNIIGFEGAKWFGGQTIEYKEWYRKLQIMSMWPGFFRKDIDIIVTHSPPAGIYKDTGYAHRGFEIYNWLIAKLQPDYFIHGHVHLNYGRKSRINHSGKTTIINAYDHYVLEV
ncbi:MAG: metallophosphoesterase family protein [Halanaerobiaceae bacterium]